MTTDAERLIAAVNEAMEPPTTYRDPSPNPTIGTTPPVPQPGRPPMSQKATDASMLMLAAGAASSRSAGPRRWCFTRSATSTPSPWPSEQPGPSPWSWPSAHWSGRLAAGCRASRWSTTTTAGPSIRNAVLPLRRPADCSPKRSTSSRPTARPGPRRPRGLRRGYGPRDPAGTAHLRRPERHRDVDAVLAEQGEQGESLRALLGRVSCDAEGDAHGGIMPRLELRGGGAGRGPPDRGFATWPEPSLCQCRLTCDLGERIVGLTGHV